MSMALYERNWVEQANCKDMDKSVFFPSSNTELKQAKKVCSTCPVSADCLQYATDNALNFGVWGGLGETDRLRLARDSRRAGF
jgi:WhiB family redox-sensing transcriptional regulator